MKIDFSDYISITDSNIISITSEGIRHTNGFISFYECAQNYKEEYGGDGNCVGERCADDNPRNIVFYTAPLTTCIHFLELEGIKGVFSGNDCQRFFELQRQINNFGFYLTDMI